VVAALGTPAGADRADRAAFTKQHRRLDRTTSARLAAIGREERITLNTFIHAAWTLLVARYIGQSDVLYGAVVSGRAAEIPGVESMVGLFTNLVPVRSPPPARFATVRDWLRAAQDIFLAIRRHEHSALADVETWSELPGHPPLFDSYIVLESIPHAEAIQHHFDPTSPCSLVQLGIPLRVEVWPGPQILLLLHYRRYFRDEVIAEVLGDLEHVVQFLLDGVDQPPRLPRR
jgi:non-ribosomal peptide synthetase component F